MFHVCKGCFPKMFHLFPLVLYKSWGDISKLFFKHIVAHTDSYKIAHFQNKAKLSTLPKTNSSPLKMDGWKTTFLLGRPIFRGYVSFREGPSIHGHSLADILLKEREQKAHPTRGGGACGQFLRNLCERPPGDGVF